MMDPSRVGKSAPKRATFARLVCDGLGYCCPYGFFRFGSRRTGAIAARLGLSDRAIRYQKATFRAGNMVCAGNANCLKEALKGRK